MSAERAPAQKIVFGSMRMHEYEYPLEYWVDLFKSLYNLGIRTFHSSSEYDSFSLYLEALGAFVKKYPAKEIRHIVKLAEPDFHLTEFDPALLEQKIESYLDKLKIDRLYCVQWMWRGTLTDHPQRLKSFEEQYPKIRQTVQKLKRTGKIENFHCFPYDPGFAMAAVRKEEIDGLVVYRNRLEEEFTNALKFASEFGKESFIIRPLYGGKILESSKGSPAEFVKWAVDFPNVEGAILSISSIEKIREII